MLIHWMISTALATSQNKNYAQMIFCPNLILRRLKRLLLVKMCSNTHRVPAHLLYINSASARIWMKYIRVFHSHEQLMLPKFAPGKFVASYENKTSIRAKLLIKNREK